MFNFSDKPITKVFNPLNATNSSMIEFNVGALADTGLYRIKKIIELNTRERLYSRYLVYSISEDAEYIFEVFQCNNGQLESYLYELADTIPFSEEFLDVAGQRFMTTPDGVEFQRSTMPDLEDRINGVSAKVKVYDIESSEIEREFEVLLWDYAREEDGITEYLNVEMSQEDGMFKIFMGEMIEDIFYKFYQTAK